MNLLIGIFIGIIVYSFILTIVMLYKDNSSYVVVETLDVIESSKSTLIDMELNNY